MPGAIGAWRRQAVVEAGGYSSDTLAEDADLTVAIERQNWKVLYEPRAYARTEAPETVRAFVKQRFRWMFGTLQMAYKHSGAMVSGKPGGVAFITIPNILLFQFAFTLFAPIIDVLLVWLVVTTLAWDMTPTDQATMWTVAQFWLLFQVLDVAAATLAMKLDEDWKNWSLLPLLLLQRFCYRQLLYFVAARTVLAAIKGRFVGWGKLIRTGRVSQQGSPVPRHSIPLLRSKLVGLRRPMRGARLNERGA